MSIESRAESKSTSVAAAGALTNEQLGSLRTDFEANRRWRNSQNAVTQVSADDVALNRGVVNSTDHTFSHVLDDWAVTNQKMTGRCWMFAGLNLFRVGAMAKMGLKEFEF
jgi:bleomycin hydrolase